MIVQRAQPHPAQRARLHAVRRLLEEDDDVLDTRLSAARAWRPSAVRAVRRSEQAQHLVSPAQIGYRQAPNSTKSRLNLSGGGTAYSALTL